MIKAFSVIFLTSLNIIAQVRIDKSAVTIAARFSPPAGFERSIAEPTSFGAYLRQLPLKTWNSNVLYFDGRSKNTPDVYVSVVNLGIGRKDLHQCADAVMRLWAEYLYANRRFEDIHFNFLADGKPRYFKKYAQGDYSYPKFWKYMESIFASANTRSLHAELKPVPMSKMQIGDVFIQKGVPFGHAVLVVDMAQNPATGQQVYLLAQSYMPAQEIQLLINPNNASISPWYELKNETIETPEWTFEPVDLRRFSEKE
ncbi:DUF4846 domain-containing protein [Runella sp.]|jgi:hypothetical protein|uniref:DUF4846 domain-containing protein n=1 Tax=Runella sp. TaxID=1960881 RepID=UPI003018E42A